MKPPVLHSALFALLVLLLSPMAIAYLPCLRQQACASPSPADSVHFSCQLVDHEQLERDRPLPAAKRLAESERRRTAHRAADLLSPQRPAVSRRGG